MSKYNVRECGYNKAKGACQRLRHAGYRAYMYSTYEALILETNAGLARVKEVTRHRQIETIR